MKRTMAMLLALLMLMTGVALAGEAVEEAAMAIVQHFRRGEYEAVAEMLSQRARESVGAEQLRSAWEQRVGELGALTQTELTLQGDYAVVQLTHEKGAQLLVVGLNEAGEVETLALQAAPDVNAEAAVERSLPEGVEARAVKLFEGTEKELNGELLVPSREDAVYAVLVQGSGASDQDESIGPNKPFRDLAYDLAALGIGSLRFDKITYAHPELGAETVEDEYLAPTAEALRVLRDETGAGRVILIGHSQGGMLMPWLVTECGFDGGVALAGTPRQLWEISWQQNLAMLDSMPAEQREAAAAQIEAERARAEALAELEDGDTVFGMPVKYLRFMAQLDELELARASDVPMLFAWGEADFQVSRDDFEAWCEGLGEDARFAFVTYPGLNHLFMEAQEGDSIANVTAVYSRASSMDARVAADIAAWLNG